MQVSLTATQGLERRLTVAIPAEQVEKEIESRLKNLSRRARLDGFRPGKAPLSIVTTRYGASVRAEVHEELLKSSFTEAVNQQRLRPAGNPQIETLAAEPGKGIEYTAAFEIYPEIGEVSLSGLAVTRPVAEITDADVTKVIERLRTQNIEWTAAERPAQQGDRLMVDLHGTLNGQDFAGGQGHNIPVILGEGRYIAGFEEQLVGAAAHATVTLNLTFPADYPRTELANAPVQFVVTIHSVEAPNLPPVDDAFAARFGITEGGVDALQQEVRANMQREMEQMIKARVKTAVLDALLSANPLDLPKALIADEQQQLREQARQNGVAAAPDAVLEAQAKRRVALGLLIAELIRKHGIKSDPARLRALVEASAASYENPEQVAQWYYSNPKLLQGVEALALEDAAVDWILEQITVTPQPMPFDALMNPSASTA